MTEPSFKLTLDVTAPSETVLTAWAITHLRGRGYAVITPGEQWEKLCDFLARIGLRKSESFHASLERWELRGHSIPRDCGPTGRIIRIASNPAFDAFCRRNKK